MQDPGRRLLFFEDLRDLAIRLAGMDDQGQPAGTRRRDMDAENALLNIARAQIVVKVEARLANPDDFRVFGQREKLVG
jgi:hypothetical protein